MLIIITNNILGVNEEIVSPYNEDTNVCLLVTGKASILIFRINMADTKPIVNVQNKILIIVFNNGEVKS